MKLCEIIVGLLINVLVFKLIDRIIENKFFLDNIFCFFKILELILLIFVLLI